MAGSARSLDRYDRDPVFRLLQHRRDEIAQAHAGEELGIKGVAIHGRFVHELVIEAHLAGGLTQDRRSARAECGELLGIFAAARGGKTDRMKLLELAGLFVEDFKGSAARAKKPWKLWTS